MAKKHTIWSDDIDIEKWEPEFFENMGLSDDATDEEKYEAAATMNAEYREDERANLRRELPGRVLCIADLGRWDGRYSGYKLLGRNLNSILDVYADDLYCDAYNVVGRESHHDGVNHYTFRMIPDGVDAQRLLDAIYEGTATPAMIRRYTRSLRPYVSAVYGWGGRKLKGVA